MRHLAPLAALLALGLVGCATVEPGVAWFLDEVPGGVKLAAGTPQSDDVRLMMTCRARTGVVHLTVTGRPGDPAVVELRSGKKLFRRYGGAGHASEDGLDELLIDFELPADDPVLARFGDTGELSMLLGVRETRLPNGFAPAHDFLRVCRRG